MYFNRIKDIYNNNGNIPDLWRDVQEAHKHGTTYTSSQTDGQTDKQTDKPNLYIDTGFLAKD